jgi:hypothetical protein
MITALIVVSTVAVVVFAAWLRDRLPHECGRPHCQVEGPCDYVCHKPRGHRDDHYYI